MQDNKPGQEAFVTIFDDTYDQPDCRAYFRMMDALGYRNQHHATAAFRAALAEVTRLRGLTGGAEVLDFACSYGIVSLLMRHDITLADIFRRYRDARFDDATPADVIAWDRDWLSAHRRAGCEARFTGLDVAANAVSYACATGILEAGFAEDLSAQSASPALQAALARCDIIVEAGSVAHLIPGVLDQVLSAVEGPKPWVISSPIRGNERAAAFDVMRDHGLVAERMSIPPFIHRRFEGAGEQARGVENARAHGHDPQGYESTGHFHAELILARPQNELTDWQTWPTPALAGPFG